MNVAAHSAMIRLSRPDDVDGFLAALKRMLCAGIAPETVNWFDGTAGQAGLFDQRPADIRASADTHARTEACADAATTPIAPERSIRLPRSLLELARTVALHDDPLRFTLIHTMADAVLRDRRVWDDSLNETRLRLERMGREVGREIHKMHAFVRFRIVPDADGEVTHVAWFEPGHWVVRAASPFFVKRFASMRWAVLTPRGCARWDRRQLSFAGPAARSDAPAADAGEALWTAYYRSIFNPARVNAGMMRREMPIRFWPNLPEAAAIDDLLKTASARTARMITQVDIPSRQAVRRKLCGPMRAAEPRPGDAAAGVDDWGALRRRAQSCSQCAFADQATQTVFGEGPLNARLMLVGEQPGDEEDLHGRPFVGPAGRLLRRALTRLGWPAERLYLTNAVKHFKYEWRGKRRMHKTAAQREAMACADWLEAEIALVRPAAIVALGRTAATSLLGRDVRIAGSAGTWQQRADGVPVLVVPHPAAVLRAPAHGAALNEEAWTELLGRAVERFPSGQPWNTEHDTIG